MKQILRNKYTNGRLTLRIIIHSGNSYFLNISSSFGQLKFLEG